MLHLFDNYDTVVFAQLNDHILEQRGDSFATCTSHIPSSISKSIAEFCWDGLRLFNSNCINVAIDIHRFYTTLRDIFTNRFGFQLQFEFHIDVTKLHRSLPSRTYLMDSYKSYECSHSTGYALSVALEVSSSGERSLIIEIYGGELCWSIEDSAEGDLTSNNKLTVAISYDDASQRYCIVPEMNSKRLTAKFHSLCKWDEQIGDEWMHECPCCLQFMVGNAYRDTASAPEPIGVSEFQIKPLTEREWGFAIPAAPQTVLKEIEHHSETTPQTEVEGGNEYFVSQTSCIIC